MNAVRRVVSGGQTGADRAALDAARAAGIAHGGWCPAGGLAEDLTEPPGLLARYPGLRETGTADPAERTRLNVRDSDATLAVVPSGAPTGGTLLALREAARLVRPCLVTTGEDPEPVLEWLAALGKGITLNVAGPRESALPGTYVAARSLLDAVLARAGAGEAEPRRPRGHGVRGSAGAACPGRAPPLQRGPHDR